MRKTLLIAAILASAPVYAQQTAADHAAHHPAPAAASAKSALSDAEVRRVDVRGQKLSLRHGEIKNLDMPLSAHKVWAAMREAGISDDD
jgi:Cu/Ag efflux protein CusF